LFKRAPKLRQAFRGNAGKATFGPRVVTMRGQPSWSHQRECCSHDAFCDRNFHLHSKRLDHLMRCAVRADCDKVNKHCGLSRYQLEIPLSRSYKDTASFMPTPPDTAHIDDASMMVCFIG
jgi:hypothetical protein